MWYSYRREAFQNGECINKMANVTELYVTRRRTKQTEGESTGKLIQYKQKAQLRVPGRRYGILLKTQWKQDRHQQKILGRWKHNPKKAKLLGKKEEDQ